jgi:hypothetical protein
MTAKPYLAPCLATFRATINEQFPHRDKSSDGWIGDAAHAARKSEHNPDDKGCVHAIDVDVDDGDSGRDLRREILNAVIGHKAVWYVISNGVIYSRTYGWKARKYTGADGHFGHVHISILLTSAAENDTTLRLVKTAAPTPWGPLYGGVAGTRVVKRWSRGADVRQLQDVLNKWYPKRAQLDEDGEFGADTEATVKFMQKNSKLKVDGIVGAKTWEKLGFDDRIPA